jgi:hypothetical protein
MRRRQAIAALAGAALAVLLALWLWPAGPPAGAPSPPGPAVAGRGPVTADGLPDPGLVASGPAPAGNPAPRGAFEGTVLSRRTGAGLPGAEVTFSRGGAAASVRSGADGSFRFEPPEAGRWQLAAASAPGHVPFAPEWGYSPVVLDARPGERVRGLSLWLLPLDRYAGRVDDPEGRPVEGAEVRVVGSATGDRALIPSSESATSGPGGAFTLSAPDGATLEACHPGYAPGRTVLDFAARSTRRVVVKLGAAGTRGAPAPIAGRVVSGGAPVEGALVAARLLLRVGPGSAGEPVTAQATTDADGRFGLRELGPGRYLLTASREGFAQARAVVARAGEEATVELSRGGTLSGVVRDAGTGAPLAPFHVEARRGGRGWKLLVGAATVVDASGRFELRALPPGPVVLLASAPGHLPSPEVEATVPEHPGVAEVEIRLRQGGRVSGRVTDRATGRPLAGAQVLLEGDGGSEPSLLDAGASAVSGDDGAFVVGGLPARTVSLHVAADGHHARIVTGVEVPDGGLAGPVDVKLTPVAEGEEPRVELAGIGAGLERRGRQALRITMVVPGGGAAEAGLAVGDEVLSVEGRPVSELGLAGAVDLIRGPEDTRVRLLVRQGEMPAAEMWVWRRLVRG